MEKRIMFVGIPADVANRILTFYDAIQLNAHQENELFDHDFDVLRSEDKDGIKVIQETVIDFEDFISTRQLRINRRFEYGGVEYIELPWNCPEIFQKALLSATGNQVPLATTCLEFKYENDNFQDFGGKGVRIGGSIIKGAKSFVEVQSYNDDGIGKTEIKEVEETIDYWTEEKQQELESLKLKQIDGKKRRSGRNSRKNS